MKIAKKIENYPAWEFLVNCENGAVIVWTVSEAYRQVEILY